MRIFVNEKVVSVTEGSTVMSAVTQHDSDLGQAVSSARGYVTDGVGREVDPHTRVKAGDILRVVLSARRPPPDGTPA